MSNVYKPSELRAFLKKEGVYAKKALSQNFLIDRNILDKIVRLAGVEAGDRVVEIGPGPGALTEALLRKGAHVIAIEMDSHFAPLLERLQTSDHRLQILQADALEQSFEKLFPGSSYKVVANLPYHITTPLLVKLLPLYPKIQSLTIMVQKEFAERMLAKPGNKDYSSFTLFTQFYSNPGGHFLVSPTCFYPQPRVQSAVVLCALCIPPLPAHEQDPFFELVRSCFQKRRKMVKTALKPLYPSIEKALISSGLNPETRPEDLSLEQFIALFRAVSSCE
ncbi:MAG: ribosomal RNA small subunit methyltransferase A [Verrucomicrobia bacterium]|nr:ribosomal RNA small subunit methyltransferase A [Verrucomicrobiota bacterium]